MKRIQVYKQFTIFHFILTVFVILFIFIIYSVFSSNNYNIGNLGAFNIIFFVMLIFIIGILFMNVNCKTSYVSDILIYDDYIQLIYKSGVKKTGVKKIKKSDIVSFTAYLDVQWKIGALKQYTDYKMKVIIKLINEKNTEFDIRTDKSCYIGHVPYQFMFDIIKNSLYIPNFSYEVTGECQNILKKLKNFDLKRR